MTKAEIAAMLADHAAWRADIKKGKRANFGGADLWGADLASADLGGANLRRADLRGASLGGTDLGGAYHVIALGQPNGWWAFAYQWEGTIWLRVGCRTMSIADGRAYWAGKEDRREVLAALDYAEAIAKLRGWEVTAGARDRDNTNRPLCLRG